MRKERFKDRTHCIAHSYTNSKNHTNKLIYEIFLCCLLNVECVFVANWWSIQRCHSTCIHFHLKSGVEATIVDKKTTWTNIALHQPVTVMKETNDASIQIGPYCCKITISQDLIRLVLLLSVIYLVVTVCLIFFARRSSVNGTVADANPRVSPITEGGGQEIPVIMNVVHPNKAILEKMKTFVEQQVKKMSEPFNFDGHHENSDDEEESQYDFDIEEAGSDGEGEERDVPEKESVSDVIAID